ncbi:hypothetical protein Sjap_000255 [Stephania japonica]|uniref:Protein kinase domain-containing protein n=1 Tax=Stephania japonica TaxID=461633 RepID=A0AAP0KK93_9MAGN
MEGSSESGHQKNSGNFRGTNAYGLPPGQGLRLRAGNKSLGGGGSEDAVNDAEERAGELVLSHRGNDRLGNAGVSSGVCRDDVGIGSVDCDMGGGDVSLRQWLDRHERSVEHLECLHIFRQIVEIVNIAHSQGIVVHNVRPSCFVKSSFSRVSFIESCSGSDPDSFENDLSSQVGGGQQSSSRSSHGVHKWREKINSESCPLQISPAGTSQRVSDTTYLQSSSIFPACVSSSIKEAKERKQDSRNNELEEMKKQFPLKQTLILETSWYTSPEEVDEASSSFSSDIYRLGILLFELFCPFNSMGEKLSTMSNLRHRVLPPQLLLKWPKEASFCLWLLHPQPSTRPKMSEVLGSEFLKGPSHSLEEREAVIKLREEIEEHELLLEFLAQMQQRKQEAADKLQGTIYFLSSDIDEVMKRRSNTKRAEDAGSDMKGNNLSAVEKAESTAVSLVKDEDLSGLSSRKRSRPNSHNRENEEQDEHPVDVQKLSLQSEIQEIVLPKSSRMMKNFKKLESAYFSTRSRLIESTRLPNRRSQTSSSHRESAVMTEGSSVDNLACKQGHPGGRKNEWINPFLEGLCKYLSFSKLQVKADLKQGDLLNSSNLVCSLGFDRDREFFATAGVNRKIKIFECETILNEDRDIRYPVVEMVSASRLSSICWNGYIKNQIASSDFEGVVQVWDIAQSRAIMEMREHERRVWSVDFSLADPTKLASGSDDGAVKLWNTNQERSIGTIKAMANVCSVQFRPDSAHALAIGSADHRIYFYDLRNSRMPLYTLVGHTKTVSYVKFVDSKTLVSASTDNSLKLWDLSTCTSRVLDNPLQTFTGHTNVKNFVGLSIYEGYIATGSETNEVFVYHKAFPMPVLSFRFSSTDPLSGLELDDGSQFVSSVCWRGQSSTLVAANSTGNIKLLEMV